MVKEFSYFKFSIKNNKYQLYKRFGAFIFILNAVAFFYLSTANVPPFTHLLFITLGICLAGYAAFSFFTKSKDKTFIALYIISAMAWISELGYYSPAVVLIVLMVMQILAQFKVYLTINKDGIILKSFTDKNIDWKELQHFILKDGLMTIELPGDKMMQLEPDFTEDVTVQKGGSLNYVKWNIDETYPELETAVNHFYQKMANKEA